jgi:hypothetical protein
MNDPSSTTSFGFSFEPGAREVDERVLDLLACLFSTEVPRITRDVKRAVLLRAHRQSLGDAREHAHFIDAEIAHCHRQLAERRAILFLASRENGEHVFPSGAHAFTAFA